MSAIALTDHLIASTCVTARIAAKTPAVRTQPTCSLSPQHSPGFPAKLRSQPSDFPARAMRAVSAPFADRHFHSPTPTWSRFLPAAWTRILTSRPVATSSSPVAHRGIMTSTRHRAMTHSQRRRPLPVRVGTPPHAMKASRRESERTRPLTPYALLRRTSGSTPFSAPGSPSRPCHRRCRSKSGRVPSLSVSTSWRAWR